DMANSARSWSLSAWISAIDTGIAASRRRVVSRSARPWTNGMVMSAMRLAARKPSPKYMIGSIMDKRLRPDWLGKCAPCHAAGATSSVLDVQREPAADTVSERIPGRVVGELEITDVGAEAHADAGADRDEHDPVRGEHRHAESADEVRRSVDSGEMLVD